MARVWTRETPMRLLPEAEAEERAIRARASSKSSAKPGSADAARPMRAWVQAGAYGSPQAEREAIARLQAAGHSVYRQRLRQGEIVVILTGPYGTDGELQQALRAVRAAGFDDAVARH